MAELAESLLQCTVHVIEAGARKDAILSAIGTSSSAVLLPYDRDHNNEPCMRGGAKAHWAVLIGQE